MIFVTVLIRCDEIVIPDYEIRAPEFRGSIQNKQ